MDWGKGGGRAKGLKEVWQNAGQMLMLLLTFVVLFCSCQDVRRMQSSCLLDACSVNTHTKCNDDNNSSNIHSAGKARCVWQRSCLTRLAYSG